MKVLVIAASKYGATQEIAEVIGASLREAGLEVTVTPVEKAPPPGGFDAVVLGSALYMGRWLKAARAYVTDHEEALRTRPVWLFSSGPLGDPPTPDPEALDLTAVVDATRPHGQRVFAGRIDKARLRFGDRAIVRAVGAPQADDRPWPDIRAWGDDIATSLVGPAAVS